MDSRPIVALQATIRDYPYCILSNCELGRCSNIVWNRDRVIRVMHNMYYNNNKSVT